MLLRIGIYSQLLKFYNFEWRNVGFIYKIEKLYRSDSFDRELEPLKMIKIRSCLLIKYFDLYLVLFVVPIRLGEKIYAVRVKKNYFFFRW